jgi:hypothetical protein
MNAPPPQGTDRPHLDQADEVHRDAAGVDLRHVRRHRLDREELLAADEEVEEGNQAEKDVERNATSARVGRIRYERGHGESAR